MGVIVKKVELSWLDRTYFWPIWQGMVVTFGHFIRQLFTSTAKRYTIQYPDMKKPMPDGYRGLHELKRFQDGSIKCVACFMCAEACPARCIHIEAGESPWPDREKYPILYWTLMAMTGLLVSTFVVFWRKSQSMAMGLV